MDKLTNVDWIWEQRFPIEKLTEEELESIRKMIDEMWETILLNTGEAYEEEN